MFFTANSARVECCVDPLRPPRLPEKLVVVPNSWVADAGNTCAGACSGFQAKSKSLRLAPTSARRISTIAGQTVLLSRIAVMAPCQSKVFFPDDPRQQPQFSDCPREAQTTRRISYSVMKLCSTCARVWDEQDRQNKEAETSRDLCSHAIGLPIEGQRPSPIRSPSPTLFIRSADRTRLTR